MTPEMLLQPRYKVIADYPHNPYRLFDLLDIISGDRFLVTKHCDTNTLIHRSIIEKMPHLFRKLEWWEDRKPEDMPEYVKDKQIDTVLYKVYGWVGNDNSMFLFADNPRSFTHTMYFEPATETEYFTYQNSLK